MILYHGTNFDFDKIDLSRSNPFKDFGKGFYLTDIRSQAEELANELQYKRLNRQYFFGTAKAISLLKIIR